jgi:hypothetical protein
MAQALQRDSYTPPAFVFNVDVIDELFDDADAELIDIARTWAEYGVKEAA